MQGKGILFVLFATLTGLVLAGCSGAPTPTPPPPTRVATIAASNANSAAPSSAPSGSKYETKSNDAGSVTVDVTPTALGVGTPLAFDVVMNTHSVDLGADMTQITILRDDAGKEYKPTAWEGPGGGGHHREGTLTFAALAGKPKYVELVIKGLAKVNERVFKWELP